MSPTPHSRVPMPYFLYGTAWKEEQTERLTRLALEAGFRGIDTANQRRHYYEEGVGRALQGATATGLVKREELFLQTKFTFRGGQDQRLPYDPAAPIAQQVEQSLASSLEHLRTDYVDSFVLHGPNRRVGLGQDDWEAWRTMEAAQDAGRARMLGVSNVTLEQLTQLVPHARLRPTFVQNRCFAVMGWDREVREFCAAHNMVYQGFSLLTANLDVVRHPDIARIAHRYQRAVTQIIFRFALDVGMLPLTGTTNAAHMEADLSVFDFQLEPDEVDRIEYLATN